MTADFRTHYSYVETKIVLIAYWPATCQAGSVLTIPYTLDLIGNRVETQEEGIWG